MRRGRALPPAQRPRHPHRGRREPEHRAAGAREVSGVREARAMGGAGEGVALHQQLPGAQQPPPSIAHFAPEDMRVRLLSSEGWVIAEAGRLDAPRGDAEAAARKPRRRWLENIVYRSLIAPGLTQAQDFAANLPRVAAPEIWQALSGIAATAWHPAASENQVVLAAAVPLMSIPITPPSAAQTVPTSPATRERGNSMRCGNLRFSPLPLAEEGRVRASVVHPPGRPA